MTIPSRQGPARDRSSILLLYIQLTVIILCAGCDLLDHHECGSFTLRVVDADGSPVIGAAIFSDVGSWVMYEGMLPGGHKTYCAAVTDSEGYAAVSREISGHRTWILQMGFLPLEVPHVTASTYRLTATPERLERIGPLTGEAVWWAGRLMATADWYGTYRLYAFEDDGVEEVATTPFPTATHLIKVVGDTLWMMDGNGDLYAFDLEVPGSPRQLLRLDFGVSTPGSFDIQGDLLVTGRSWNAYAAGPVCTYRFTETSELLRLASCDSLYVHALSFTAPGVVAIVARDLEGALLALTLDLDDPSRPVESDRILLSGGLAVHPSEHGFEFLDLHGYHTWEIGTPGHREPFLSVIDFTDSGQIFESPPAAVPMRIYRVVSPGLLLGVGPWDFPCLGLMRGSIDAGYRIVTFIEVDQYGWGGQRAPWFQIGPYLWRHHLH